MLDFPCVVLFLYRNGREIRLHSLTIEKGMQTVIDQLKHNICNVCKWQIDQNGH